MLEKVAQRIFAVLVAASAWLGLGLYIVLQRHSVSVGAIIWTITRYFSFWVDFAVGLYFTVLVLRPSAASATLIGGITLNVTLVAVVYHVMIADIHRQVGAEGLANLLVHIVTPALVALFWVLCVPRGRLHPRDIGAWTVPPLLYFSFALVRGGADGIYPYAFMNVLQIGWGETALNTALIAAGFLIAGNGLLWFDQHVALARTIGKP